MTPKQIAALYILAGFAAFGFFYRRREAIIHAVRGTVLACICATVAFLLLWKAGLSPINSYVVALVIAVLVRRTQPRRSRYIPARVKRQVIAKWERETGESFNRRIHEIDHTLPHSRGGGNFEDNLRVLTKKQNRSKGAGHRWKE